jgi:hypothetical protein
VTAEEPVAASREAEAQQLHLESMREEAETYSDEYNSLPLVIASTIPLLVFGSLLMSVLGLTSRWWYLALIGGPWLAFYLYPHFLLYRLKTPLRMPGGSLISGKTRRHLIIISAIMAVAWLLIQIFAVELKSGW